LWDDRSAGDFKLDIIFDRGIAEGVLQGLEAWFLSDAFEAIMQTAAQAELPELAQLNLKIGMERAISARAILP
jgi:hypothetical protein